MIKPPTSAIYGDLKAIAPEYPPLGLAYLAACLEQAHHEVRIRDLSIEPFDIGEIRRFRPHIIGVSANTPTADIAYKLVDDMRAELPDVLFVLGGPHPTAMPDEALEHADIVVRGEGELTLLEVADGHPLKGIDGISYRLGTGRVHNPDREFCTDLDSFPFPARHLLKMDRYHYLGARKYPITNIITTRGCPYRCTYCNKNIAGYKFRARSVANIMAEIDYLVAELGIKEIHISDDTFTLDKQRVHELCAELKERNYDLAFYPHNGFRVDTVDYELLKDMKEAGFYAMVFGVESGNQQVLDSIQKGITLDQVRDAFRVAKQLQFETWGFFILGLRGETKETAMDTIRFAIELDPDVAKFQILVPYPGTPDYELLKGRMRVTSWSDYLFYNGSTFEPEHMSVQELNSLFKTAYRRFYLRPRQIWRRVRKGIASPASFKESVIGGMSVLRLTGGK